MKTLVRRLSYAIDEMEDTLRNSKKTAGFYYGPRDETLKPPMSNWSNLLQEGIFDRANELEPELDWSLL